MKSGQDWLFGLIVKQKMKDVLESLFLLLAFYKVEITFRRGV